MLICISGRVMFVQRSTPAKCSSFRTKSIGWVTEVAGAALGAFSQPTRVGDFGDRRFDAFVRVGDDELHPAQAPPAQLA